MCYDIKTHLESQLGRAKRKGNWDALYEIILKLERKTDLPLFHASGFEHPKLLIYTNESPDVPTISQWGLVPISAKAKEAIWNRTLNAKGATLFQKAPFKNSAKRKRCIIHVDGFYEHHYHDSGKIPYFISRKDRQPLSLAGLWNEWIDKTTGRVHHTFAIVTTDANAMMEKIYNNPRTKGPRMPVIIPEELEDEWLAGYDDKLVKQAIYRLIKPFPESELQAHTVGKVRGEHSLGNVMEANAFFEYEGIRAEY